MLIFLTGFPGSGKSFLGKQAAALLDYDFVDSDQLIEQKLELSVRDIFDKHGEDYFRLREAELIRSLANKNKTIVAVGGGLPCFHENMQWMAANGFTIYLEASAAFLFHRLMKEKNTRPLIEKLTDVELMIYITETLASRRSFYEMAEAKTNAETFTPAKLVSLIRKKGNLIR